MQFRHVGGGVISGTQSVDRTLALVSLVVRSPVALTWSDLVEATGLPRSTVSRLLGALEAGGLLERDAAGGYRGGALFEEYARSHDRVAALVALAHPHLEDLAEQTGETVNLAVARGSQVVHVDQVDARWVIGSVSWLGIDVPPHLSALGKVMLAWGAVRPPSGRLETRTPASLATHAALETELAKVRARGHALTRGELEDGLDGVAAPVRGPGGAVVAALGVSGPTFRIGEQRAEIAARLDVHAAALSRDLVRRPRRDPQPPVP